MLAVALRLEVLLMKSEDAKTDSSSSSSTHPALAFIVIVPGWSESPMWCKLHSSSYLRACWSISSQGA
jgi:hypothetical protein